MLIHFISIFTAGCFSLLAFIVAINPKQVNIQANRWLAVYLFCVTFILIDDPMIYGSYCNLYPIISEFINVPIFAIGPLMYFSISHFVSPAKIFVKKDLWHFSLSILMFLTWLMSLFSPSENKIELGKTENQADLISGLILIILPISIYWILSYKKLLAHKKNVELFASNTETIDLAWLQNFLFGLAASLIMWSAQLVFSLAKVGYVANFFYLASAFYLAYFALQQVEIFSEKPQIVLEIKDIIEENEQNTATKKQLLTEEEILMLKEKIKDLMLSQKPYLDSTLSLPKLAILLDITTHELSYLINTGFDDNFFGFVNHYRVEESKYLLTSQKHEHLSMVGIAFEAGFNSKTAFNTTFKKNVGMSPTDFQKKVFQTIK